VPRTGTTTTADVGGRRGGSTDPLTCPEGVGNFLAIYNGGADDQSRSELSEEQQVEFLRAWDALAQTNRAALIDPGWPLFSAHPHPSLSPRNSIEVLESTAALE
jgi:hypothetical protein